MQEQRNNILRRISWNIGILLVERLDTGTEEYYWVTDQVQEQRNIILRKFRCRIKGMIFGEGLGA